MRSSVRLGLLSLAVCLLALQAWPQSIAPFLNSPSNAKRFVVVAPRAFHPALKEFIAYKQQLMPTDLCSWEEIVDGSSGVDDAEKLKRYLYQQWREHQLGYALLVGDIDTLPVRYMALDRITPAAYDYSFYPSDLYYSDLARQDGSFDDWNARKDSFHATYFGEVRGEKNKNDEINFDKIDYRPDIAVGRWPVSTPEETRILATKTITCEKRWLAANSNANPRSAFVSVGGWVDTRSQMDRWRGKMTNFWRVDKAYYSDAKRPSGTPKPDHAAVRAFFNEGVDLVVHSGHGQPRAWEQCFSFEDLDRITNNSRLPVVISAGCSTAHFAPLPPYESYVDIHGVEHKGTDKKEVFTNPPPPPALYQRDRFNPTGLGEQILKGGPNGAVAYIGCNTGSHPCGLTLVEGFITALAASKAPRLGDCWTEAIRYYYEREHLATMQPNESWYPPSVFFQGMKFMLFGDPTFRLPGSQK